MKDLFSEISQIYKQARPSYPHAVVAEILQHVPQKHFVWDCGAGSGQFTQLLSPYFEQVVATDLSAQQLHHAPYFENVSYQVQQAEKTSFVSQSFDLITVAQAIHWFDFNAFYAEVKRTLKPKGILAVIGYGLIQAKDLELNQIIQDLYSETLNGYWGAERRYVDESYQSIPFPFEEIESPNLHMQYQWTFAQLLNYLGTWSAIKKYKQTNDQDPLHCFESFILKQDHNGCADDLANLIVDVEFPIFLRLGRLKSTQKRRKGKTVERIKSAFKT